MKVKIAKLLIVCMLFTLVIPLNVLAATATKSITFTMDDSYVNGNIYTTVIGVMANQGKYLVWGKYGNVQTSTDGIDWNLGSSTWSHSSVANDVYAAEGTLSKIVYNDREKKYVGIGQNCYASSTDGTTWQLENSSNNQDTNDLLYAGGKYYTVNDGNGGSIQQSTDGKNWRKLPTGLPSSSYYNLNAITYAQGKYIVVGSNGTVLSSSDGESWSKQTVVLANSYINLMDVIYAGGQYVIVGNYGTVLTSSDGKTWVTRDSGLTGYSNNLRSIGYGNGKYVAVGANKVINSTNGINWSSLSGTSQYGYWNAQVCFDSAGFVATSGSNSIAFSKNGDIWTEKSLKPTQTIDYIDDLQFLNNEYVAVGHGFMTSIDGAIWKKENDEEDIRKISYGNGKYVAIGINKYYQQVIKTSTDGVTWQQKSNDDFYPKDISYGNGKFVLVGADGIILYSVDGNNWTEAASGVTDDLYSLIYANGHFIASGGSTIVVSTDGEKWSKVDSGLSDAPYYNSGFKFAVGNGKVIGVGNSGVILSSTDGTIWTKCKSLTTKSLTGISYGDGLFLAIGDNGTLLSSEDGVTWKAEPRFTSDTLGMIASNGSGFLIGMSPMYNDRLYRSTSTSSGTISVTDIKLDRTTLDILVGQTDLLKAIVTPTNATNKAVTWESSDPDVATVDQDGNVSGVKVGSAVITVTTEDGNKQATCTVNVNAESVKDITSFKVSRQIGDSTIDQTAHTISFHMPADTSVKRLSPTITVSAGTTISPKSKAAKDFTNPVIYTVTAKDGTSEKWTVTCIVDPKSSDKDITGFTVPKQVGSSTIDAMNHTVSFHMAYGTKANKLTPTITVSAGSSISPKSKAAKNFTVPVIYTVTAQDGTSQTWTVTCIVDPESSDKDITGFTVRKQVGSSTIDATEHTISFHMAYGTNVKKLTPTITVSEGATISPKSKAAKNFEEPVIYTVTAQDGTNQIWTVTCVVN